jgi:hypothetical protein
VGFLHDLHNLRHGDSAGRTPSFLIKLSTELQKPHPDPTKVLRDLSGEERAAFESLVGAGSFGTWLSLSGAGNLVSLYQGLLGLGKGLKNQGELEQAQAYLSLLAQARPGVAIPKEVRSEAKFELNAMTGCGDGWRRAGYLAGRLWDEATDPGMILPIMFGTIAYEGTKGLMLARWGKQVKRAEFFKRAVPWYLKGERRAEIAASAIAFVPELGIFSGLGHVMHGGEGDLSESVWRNGVTLSLLKGVGFFGRGLVEGGKLWARVLVPQGSVFVGLYGARWIEEQLDPSLRIDGATRAVDTLGTMASLGLGMYLGRGAIPYLERLHRYLATGARYHAEQLREGLAAVQLTGVPLPVGVGGPAADSVWRAQATEPEAPTQASSSSPPDGGTPAPTIPRSFRMRGYQPLLIGGDIHSSAIREVVQNHVPPSCRCLFLHVMTKPRMDTNWSKGIFSSSGNLREIHVIFIDGSVYRLRLTADEVNVEKGRYAEGFAHSNYPEAEITRTRLLDSLSGWQPPKYVEQAMGFPFYVRSLAMATGLGNGLVERLSNDPRVDRHEFETYRHDLTTLIAGQPSAFLPFSLISPLAEGCRVDVRKLIIAADRFNFSDADPRLWMSGSHPLYLEAGDQGVLKYFAGLGIKGQSKYLDSSGFLIFSRGKNPYNYYSRQELAEVLQVDVETLFALQTNELAPSHKLAQRFFEATEVPMSTIADSLRHTFKHSELPRWVQEFQPAARKRSRGSSESGAVPTVKKKPVKKTKEPKPPLPPGSSKTSKPPRRPGRVTVTPLGAGRLKITYGKTETTVSWTPSADKPIATVKVGGKTFFVRQGSGGRFSVE